MTHERIKLVGAVFLVLASLLALLTPLLAPTRSSGPRHPDIEYYRQQLALERYSYRISFVTIAVPSLLLGAGVSLLVAGCLIGRQSKPETSSAKEGLET